MSGRNRQSGEWQLGVGVQHSLQVWMEGESGWEAAAAPPSQAAPSAPDALKLSLSYLARTAPHSFISVSLLRLYNRSLPTFSSEAFINTARVGCMCYACYTCGFSLGSRRRAPFGRTSARFSMQPRAFRENLKCHICCSEASRSNENSELGFFLKNPLLESNTAPCLPTSSQT